MSCLTLSEQKALEDAAYYRARALTLEAVVGLILDTHKCGADSAAMDRALNWARRVTKD